MVHSAIDNILNKLATIRTIKGTYYRDKCYIIYNTVFPYTIFNVQCANTSKPQFIFSLMLSVNYCVIKMKYIIKIKVNIRK